MRYLVFLILALPAAAQPVLPTEVRNGVPRPFLLHAGTLELVTDESPANRGERLLVWTEGMAGEVSVLIGARAVAGLLRDDGFVEFDMPEDAGGAFVEISLESDGLRSNAVTFPTREAETAAQLTAAEVRTLLNSAAMAIDDPRLVVAVVD
ncbi:MAG: hypothetical protein ACRD44_12095, partial [Bryobacteraceae bacterium]